MNAQEVLAAAAVPTLMLTFPKKQLVLALVSAGVKNPLNGTLLTAQTVLSPPLHLPLPLLAAMITVIIKTRHHLHPSRTKPDPLTPATAMLNQAQNSLDLASKLYMVLLVLTTAAASARTKQSVLLGRGHQARGVAN